MKLFIGIAFPILMLLNLYDIYSTSMLLSLGGTEANPFMNLMMQCMGTLPAMLIVKSIFFILLIWACLKVIKKKDITKRETIAVVSGFVIMISWYGYFMYTRNYQMMLLTG